ncbi:DegV family protein [Jongsikchunia kroppenstedtii]|uniref:DegV family protein n=1 Tax=Jongsikchunia kroppenstedtii TaxID=1121721 RepID=UPI00037DAC41|nr:DegV family protein [Jongsikchunia kroppenstedtii]
MTVIVVTDSAARIPAALRERYRIREVPMHVLTADGDLREGIDAISQDVIDHPDTTTSGAIPADLEEVYSQAIADSDGDGVVAVHLSRRLSGTWSAGRLVAEKLGPTIRIVDSRSVGLGIGFAALAAAQAADDGADRDRVYEAAIRATSTTECVVCVHQLDNLRHSGRISATTRLLGSALSIKPVLQIVDGSLSLTEKQRTMTRAVAKMIDIAVEAAGSNPVSVGVLDNFAPELAEQVAEELSECMPKIDSMIRADMGPVLGSHVGSGAVAICLCTSLVGIDTSVL